ncbi:apolipoprotein Eb [Coregonus clupeaformis]|uniref:apolipoprotein Eb n=1 Tax=Coregonus clupeaformis TaxID=59861 RepID=UPI001BE02C1D|nr:apolipoprotein Eb [Coregonus clupeaformis]
MKAVAIILALTVISGCHARAVRQAEAPQNRWEENVERFWTYVSELNSRADGLVDNLKASQLSRELDTLITDTVAELTVYREDIQTKLGPYAQDTAGLLGQDLQLLTTKLQTDMVDAKERSTQYLGELKTMIEQNADDVHNRGNTYIRKLKKRLNKDTEEIRNTVATYLGEIQSRTSQNMDLVKERVEPYVSQAHDTAAERLGSFTDLLKNQAQDLSQQVSTQAEGMREQLEATAEDLRTTLEGKIDELSSLIAPYAAKIREQLQTIMDKVKETNA